MNGYSHPPGSPWQATTYLRHHGPDAPYAERANWILTRYSQYQAAIADGDRTRAMACDWSSHAWARHQREQREALTA